MGGRVTAVERQRDAHAELREAQSIELVAGLGRGRHAESRRTVKHSTGWRAIPGASQSCASVPSSMASCQTSGRAGSPCGGRWGENSDDARRRSARMAAGWYPAALHLGATRRVEVNGRAIPAPAREDPAGLTARDDGARRAAATYIRKAGSNGLLSWPAGAVRARRFHHASSAEVTHRPVGPG